MYKTILIVEDGEEHRREAQSFFYKMGEERVEDRVETLVEECFSDGRRRIMDVLEGRDRCIDGVILDIYMPQHRPLVPSQEQSHQKAIEEAEVSGDAERIKEARAKYEAAKVQSTELMPGGVVLAFLAERAGLPFVLCTAGYHHGARYDWICGLASELGWPRIVDSCSDRMGEGLHKDWELAYQRLKEAIKVKEKEKRARGY